MSYSLTTFGSNISLVNGNVGIGTSTTNNLKTYKLISINAKFEPVLWYKGDSVDYNNATQYITDYGLNNFNLTRYNYTNQYFPVQNDIDSNNYSGTETNNIDFFQILNASKTIATYKMTCSPTYSSEVYWAFLTDETDNFFTSDSFKYYSTGYHIGQQRTYLSDNSYRDGEWVQIGFIKQILINNISFKIDRTINAQPAEIDLVGSNDEITWYNIIRIYAQNADQTTGNLSVPLTLSNKYKYFRLICIKIMYNLDADAFFKIGKIQFRLADHFHPIALQTPPLTVGYNTNFNGAYIWDNLDNKSLMYSNPSTIKTLLTTIHNNKSFAVHFILKVNFQHDFSYITQMNLFSISTYPDTTDYSVAWNNNRYIEIYIYKNISDGGLTNKFIFSIDGNTIYHSIDINNEQYYIVECLFYCDVNDNIILDIVLNNQHNIYNTDIPYYDFITNSSAYSNNQNMYIHVGGAKYVVYNNYLADIRFFTKNLNNEVINLLQTGTLLLNYSTQQSYLDQSINSNKLEVYGNNINVINGSLLKTTSNVNTVRKFVPDLWYKFDTDPTSVNILYDYGYSDLKYDMTIAQTSPYKIMREIGYTNNSYPYQYNYVWKSVTTQYIRYSNASNIIRLLNNVYQKKTFSISCRFKANNITSGVFKIFEIYNSSRVFMSLLYDATYKIKFGVCYDGTTNIEMTHSFTLTNNVYYSVQASFMYSDTNESIILFLKIDDENQMVTFNNVRTRYNYLQNASSSSLYITLGSIVIGDGYLQDFRFFTNSLSDTESSALQTGALRWNSSNTILMENYQIQRWTESSTYNQFNGSNFIYYDDGNVGIGKNNPNYLLDVAGTINATEYRLNGSVFTGSGGGTVTGGTGLSSYSFSDIIPNQWNSGSNQVLWYKFNGNFNDSSGNNSNITNIGSVQFDYADYKYGTSSIQFNGTNFLALQNNGTFAPKNLSIAFWYKYKTLGAGNIYTVLVGCLKSLSFGSSQDYGYALLIYYSLGAGTYILSLITNNSSHSSKIATYTFDNTNDNNKWFHIVLTLTSTSSTNNASVYVNGVLIYTGSYAYTIYNQSTLTIGAYANVDYIIGDAQSKMVSAGHYVPNGAKMDDFRFYNTILTSNEVAQIYAGSPVNTIYTGGSVGIGTSYTSNYKLSVWGDIYAYNNVYAREDIVASYSDIRLKNVVANIENSLDMITNISTFKYTANDLARSFDIKTNKLEVGISAQDVQKVLPEVVKLAPFDTSNLETGEMVSKSGYNFLTICYERLVPLLIECIKDLKKENEDIRMRLQKLENY
jgi:hypothetical protein